jgi:hypothetical protein
VNARLDDVVICPLCDREIPPAQRDAHHLVPKSKGGRRTQFLHRVCHRQVHALLTETELARQYATVEALLANRTSRGSLHQKVSWSSRVTTPRRHDVTSMNPSKPEESRRYG